MKIKRLLHKYHELITYAIFGGFTTAVNFITYFLCSHTFHLPIVTSNIIAWFISVIFAFFTNKVYVFQKLDFEFKQTSKEFIKFTGVRAISCVFETVSLWWIVKYLHGNEFLTKFILSLVVVVINYTLSKIYIFVEEGEKSHRHHKLKALYK